MRPYDWKLTLSWNTYILRRYDGCEWASVDLYLFGVCFVCLMHRRGRVVDYDEPKCNECVE